MENPFGLGLLIAAGVIYKIYQSYKEEQEKAKKRLLDLKKKQQTVTKYQEYPKAEPVPPKRELLSSKTSKPNPYKPTKEPSFAYYEELPDEVVHVQEMKRLQKEKFAVKKESIKAPKLSTPGSSSQDQPAFDLRQAVIQDAILNRPYRD